MSSDKNDEFILIKLSLYIIFENLLIVQNIDIKIIIKNIIESNINKFINYIQDKHYNKISKENLTQSLVFITILIFIKQIVKYSIKYMKF